MVKKEEDWIGRVTWMSKVKSGGCRLRKDGVGASSEIKYGVCSKSVVDRRMCMLEV